jgi:hypothetical protein
MEHTVNGTNGHRLICSSDYPAIDITPSVPRPKWRDDFPLFTHNLSWVDCDGCSHSLTLRSDDLPGLFADLKLLKGMIRASKEKAKERHPDAPEGQSADTPAADVRQCKVYDVPMAKGISKKTGKPYFSHVLSDDTRCFGRK